MVDHPRIEELRRRVQGDPASIAFAQLAEEYRRAGHYENAVTTCRAGLSFHPGYLSARVTLGRALIELNDLSGAETELTYVMAQAPENLAAIRGLAEIHHRQGNLAEALAFYQSALRLAKHDPDLEQTVDDISRTLAPEREPVADGMSFEDAAQEFLAALDALPKDAAPARPEHTTPDDTLQAEDDPQTGPDLVLPELERFLDAIHTYRRRAV
jgi:tetratricopeptide (TPR) repeat protein